MAFHVKKHFLGHLIHVTHQRYTTSGFNTSSNDSASIPNARKWQSFPPPHRGYSVFPEKLNPDTRENNDIESFNSLLLSLCPVAHTLAKEEITTILLFIAIPSYTSEMAYTSQYL
ncbi:hypothetical protein ECG_07192 [Echinococcus granulosus]|uniref:DDE_Tnp_ISL3 domain-containing protein n=1 Tax=Echinococcus granulosus TaxID=6210 RepID=A0A068WST0_ECHGR|nr:hypothetical protein ECG_07192 [Echinococcus granulosus]CDS22838.1 hypothetical protein EgrG_000709400 [Echinococcus granulosus]